MGGSLTIAMSTQTPPVCARMTSCTCTRLARVGWAAVFGGVSSCDPEHPPFRRQAHNPSNTSSLASCHRLYCQCAENLWATTWAGRTRSCPKSVANRVVKHQHSEPESPVSIGSHHHAAAVLAEDGGSFCEGVGGGGLHLRDPSPTSSFARVATRRARTHVHPGCLRSWRIAPEGSG